MLKLRNIMFTYPGAERPALSGISLTIDKGERVCIMGGNGSGKSTFALLMAGLLNGFEGDMERRVGQADSNRMLRSAILFQNPDSRMVATTVEREIAFSLECESRSFDEMRPVVESTAAAFGVKTLSRRQTYNLSGGEKQRVALASLFVIKPDLLILDEPDSFLDVAGRRILEQELERLRQSEPELTEIRITQYLSVGQQYDRLLILCDGRLVADGPPERLAADSELLRLSGLDRTAFREFDYDRALAPVSSGSPARPIKAVELNDVSFSHSKERLLEGVSFSLERGKATAVVGPSGSGKTSLAGLVSGLFQPLSGRVRYTDDQARELSADEIRGRLVQLVQFPERQFYLATCREEIEAGPSNMNQQLGEAEVANVLGAVGLEPQTFLDRDPLTLSMGEKRRLALGCLLVMNPDFLILDEPTCGLDPAAVGWFEALMTLLKKQGVGLFLISHDAPLVRNIADNIVCLNADFSARYLTAESFFSGSDWADLLSEA